MSCAFSSIELSDGLKQMSLIARTEEGIWLPDFKRDPSFPNDGFNIEIDCRRAGETNRCAEIIKRSLIGFFHSGR